MQRRIIFAAILSVLILLVSLSVVSYLSVRESVRLTLDNHLAAARIVANNIDGVLEQNITKLYDISLGGGVDFEDNDWAPEEKALRAAYAYSIFTGGVFILDRAGTCLLTYPYRDRSTDGTLDGMTLGTVFESDRPLVTNLRKLEPTGRSALFILVPLKDRGGKLAGIAGGEMDPTTYALTKIIQTVRMDPGMSIELVDGGGRIIGAGDPRLMLTGSDHGGYLAGLISTRKSTVGTCHRCHADAPAGAQRRADVLAFAPLSFAPWGIAIREPQDVVLAPARKLEKLFILLGTVSTLVALFLAFGLSRSIVRPVKALSLATRRIAGGDLSMPVQAAGNDEISALGRSFDEMRVRLAESLDQIQRHNLELERRVGERTAALEQSREKLSGLLGALLGAQEEERLRVARELHDDTSQSMNAILMAIDSLGLRMKDDDERKLQLMKLREQVLATLVGIHRLIKDLRPPILDDLGLESAVRWTMERHLGERGIRSSLSVEGECKEALSRAPASHRQVELVLFRVIQEALINIAKHAGARRAAVSLDFRGPVIHVAVEDDGRGFDVRDAPEAGRTGSRGGFGLQGMSERIALLDGSLDIRSSPGKGTRIEIRVPIPLPAAGP